MNKQEKAETWQKSIDAKGFISGYAVIGLKTLRLATELKSLRRAVEKRVYNRKYYLANKDKLRDYHREYNRKWREKQMGMGFMGKMGMMKQDS